MAEFLNDQFVGSGRLELHFPDLGGQWDQIFTVSNGTGFTSADAVIFNGDRLSGKPSSGRNSPVKSSLYRNQIDPGTNEYDVVMNIVIGFPGDTDQFFVLCGRMSPTGTGNIDRYVAYYEGSGIEKHVMYKVVSGVFTQLDNLNQDLAGGSFELKLEIRDAAKKFYVDDGEVLSTADDVITQDGRAGLAAPEPISNYITDIVGETPSAGPIINIGNVAMTGAGVMASSAHQILAAQLPLVGAGVMLSTPASATIANLALVGAGSMAPVGHAIDLASVALAGSGAIAFSAVPFLIATVPLSGAGAMVPTGHGIALAVLPLSGAAVIFFGASSSGIDEAFLNLTGAGSMATAPFLIANATLPLAGSGAMASAPVTVILAQVNLAGAGTMLPTAELFAIANVALSGSGSMVTAEHVIWIAGLALTGAGLLFPTAELEDEWSDFGEIIRLIDAVADETYHLQIVGKSIDGVNAAEVRLYNVTDDVEVKRTSTTSLDPALVTTLTPFTITGSKRYKIQVRKTVG